MADRKSELKKGIVVMFNSTAYTNVNLTDKDALAILKSNPANERNFVAYPDKYKVETEPAKISDVKKNLAKAKEAVNKGTGIIVAAEKKVTDLTKEVDDLSKVVDENVKLAAEADDDGVKEADKAVKDAEVARDLKIEELVDAEAAVPKLKEVQEENEAEVVKLQALLTKRTK